MVFISKLQVCTWFCLIQIRWNLDLDPFLPDRDPGSGSNDMGNGSWLMAPFRFYRQYHYQTRQKAVEFRLYDYKPLPKLHAEHWRRSRAQGFLTSETSNRKVGQGFKPKPCIQYQADMYVGTTAGCETIAFLVYLVFANGGEKECRLCIDCRLQYL